MNLARPFKGVDLNEYLRCSKLVWTKATIHEITRVNSETFVRVIRERFIRGRLRVPASPGLHETFEAVREVQAGY
jgi:hypothetical protein